MCFAKEGWVFPIEEMWEHLEFFLKDRTVPLLPKRYVVFVMNKNNGNHSLKILKSPHKGKSFHTTIKRDL